MATASESLGKAADRFSRAGSDIYEGAKNAFKKAPAGAATEVVEETSKKAPLLARPFIAVGKGMWYVASRPVAWGADLLGASASKIGSGFKAHPRIGLGVAAVGAGLGIGHVMNKRSERHAQDQINELEMAQMRTAQANSMSQAQANTVTPADYAAMEARMRQGGQGQGFAANVQAQRAAAANTPAV